jgi:capsular exopolysaccharide synthesis family protein
MAEQPVATQEQRLSVIVWRGKWLILAAVLVTTALAILVTKTEAKVYDSTAILQVNSEAGSQNPGVDPQSQLVVSQGLATTYDRLIDDSGFLQQIQPQVAGGRLSVNELKQQLSATAVTGTSLVQLTAQGPSPQQAVQLASEVARAFIANVERTAEARSRQQQTLLREQINELTRQIARVSGTNASEERDALVAARTQLTAQAAELAARGAAAVGAVTLVAPPHATGIPIRPRPVLNVAAGILLGMLLGFGLAWLRARLDRGLHSPDEAEELLGVPILASIPIRRRFSREDAVLGEAYDVLRANLAFISLDRDMQVLTFTSYNPGEGKTSTIEGLAYAAVRGGINVLMIDADVRTRALSTRLGYPDVPGLTTAAIGVVDVEDAIVELAPNLALLPAGPIPPNPPSLLTSGRLREILAAARQQYALVLIDSPPVAHLADASILAASSDGIIAVARVGVTRRADLPQITANLRHSPTPLVGAVVLETRTLHSTYYPAMSKGQEPAVPEAAQSL